MVIRWAVMPSAFITPRRRLHFRVLQPTATFWCKDRFGAKEVPLFSTASNFSKFHSRSYTQCMKQGYSMGGNAQCVYCTEKVIAFLGSPYPLLPFDVNVALVQRRYHCFRQLRIFPNSILGPTRSAWNRVIRWAETPSAFIAPRLRLHFWVLHTHSYLLM